MNEYNIESLRGLKGVAVLVENIKADGLSLSESDIKKDVELKLQKTDVNILTMEECAKEPGNPCLYIKVDILKIESWLYVANIKLKLQQNTILERDPKLQGITATTWSTGWIGCFHVGDVYSESIREHIKDHVDEFVNAYLSVNPRSVSGLRSRAR